MFQGKRAGQGLLLNTEAPWGWYWEEYFQLKAPGDAAAEGRDRRVQCLQGQGHLRSDSGHGQPPRGGHSELGACLLGGRTAWLLALWEKV